MRYFNAALSSAVLVTLLLCVPTLLTACDKPVSAPYAPVSAFAPPPAATPDPVLVEAHLEATAAAAELAVVKDFAAKVETDVAFEKAEAAAYEKAKANAKRAECLRTVLDLKVNYDNERGTISDLGNVRIDPICHPGGAGWIFL